MILIINHMLYIYKLSKGFLLITNEIKPLDPCLAHRGHSVNVSHFYCLAGQKKKLTSLCCLSITFFFSRKVVGS